MEILLPEQITVDDIAFLTAELIGPERKRITRQQADTILNHWQARDIVCGSCGWAACEPATDCRRLMSDGSYGPGVRLGLRLYAI